MRIDDELFKIIYDEEKNTIFFEGSLRLNDFKRFDKIKQFMLDVYGLESPELILDFLKLDFLNSAGISTLCNFIFEIKDRNKKNVRILGNNNIQWQKKSFENLKIIWDKIEIAYQ
jgi:hypothetical protein